MASNERDKPRLIVVAGPNGSGKTTITEQLLRHQWFEGCVDINPDTIAQERFGNWNSPDAVLQAARLADQLREECLSQQRSLAFETVFSSPGKIDYIHRAKAAGFFVRMFFIGTASPLINVARVGSRVAQGGHEVPITKIIERYGKSIANCVDIAPFVDRLYVYDNSINEADAQLVFRAKEGRLVKQYLPCPTWAADIFAAAQLGPVEN